MYVIAQRREKKKECNKGGASVVAKSAYRLV